MNTQNDIDLLIEWADKAMCYSWLHNNAYHDFSYKDKCYTIPIIVLTTIAGTSSFAQSVIPNNIEDYVAMGFGGLTIFSGLLTAIKKFLNISELSESHRISKMNWEKLYREIKIEITRMDNQIRTPGNKILTYDDISNLEELINKFKNQYNHLMETSPSIPTKSVCAFQKEFSKAKYNNIQKPEICGDIEHTGNYYVSLDNSIQ